MKVKDVMQRRLVTVGPDTSLMEAGRLLFGNRIGSLPVVDEKGKLVGLVVEKDILEKLYPSQRELVVDFLREGDFEKMEEEVSDIFELPVSEVMTKEAVTADEEVSLLRAASTMILRRVSVLPVVNEEGILVGILSSNDVFRTIVGKKMPLWRMSESFYDSFAERYDVLIDWKKRLNREIPFLENVFKGEKAKKLIDIGCGTGEHGLMMAKKGFDVLGIDKSKAMIFLAREKLSGKAGKLKGKLDFKRMKISDFKERSREKFDGGYCLGNVIAHTDDLKNELVNISSVLKKGAKVVFQVENFSKLIRKKDMDLRFDIKEINEAKIEKYGFLRFYEFRKDGFLDFNVVTLVKYRDGSWKSWGEDKVIFWAIEKEEFEKLLKEAGFFKIKFYGDFDKSAYRKDKSKYLIATAEKG